MNKLVYYTKLDKCNIVGIFNEDKKFLGYTLADSNNERVTDKKFKTANEAREFSKYYETLITL